MASTLKQPAAADARTGMAERIRALDWSSTPLGAIETWPENLRHARGMMEQMGLPTALYCGPEHILLHNDAWAELLGADLLGSPASAAPETLWPLVGPVVAEMVETGRGAFMREQPLTINRGGADEETYWNCSIVPVRDEQGRIAAFLNQANEVTKTVLAERRLSFQVALADRLRGLNDPEEVKRAATQLLGEYLGAARVGYGEIDEATGTVSVRSDWTRGEETLSLAGQSGVIAAFGEEALSFLRSGEVLALPDVKALPQAMGDRAAVWEALGVRALIIVPLVRENGLKAVLYVHEPEPRAWKRSEAAMARDVAERTWAAVERAQAEQSLRDSEDHYRHAVELNPQVAWTALPDGQRDRVAGRWQEWTGTSGLGDSWIKALHPEDRERSAAAWAHSIATGEPYDIEYRVKQRDGGFRWVRSRAYPRRNDSGAICLWYGTTEDIHERKVAEEHQRLLVNELNHRVKNTLATVQAIAFQTLKGDVPLTEARARFEARLMALSRAHNLLTEQNWGRASLERVVTDATEHLAGEQSRFEARGDPIWLAPRAALALALALHELGTNAAKHGALSCEEGRIDIRWTIGDALLQLEWKESGGPLVVPPSRSGFGSRLIEKGLEADLGGSARLIFEPDGLRCVIEASLDAIRPADGELG
jgi:PAS domain S-box-containing protein